MIQLRWLAPALRALVTEPGLWPTAIRQAFRLAPTGWWRRRPFLPLPTRAYLEFRAVTMYGDATARPRPEDVRTYLRWCRRFPRSASAA